MLLRFVIGVCAVTVLACGPAPAVRDPELPGRGNWFCGDSHTSYGWGCARDRAACGADCVNFDTVWCFKVSSGDRCYPDAGVCWQQERGTRGALSSCRERT